jgi:hypothetical protein
MQVEHIKAGLYLKGNINGADISQKLDESIVEI